MNSHWSIEFFKSGFAIKLFSSINFVIIRNDRLYEFFWRFRSENSFRILTKHIPTWKFEYVRIISDKNDSRKNNHQWTNFNLFRPNARILQIMKRWLWFRSPRSNEKRYRKHHRDSMKSRQIDSIKKHSSFFFHSRHLIFRQFQKNLFRTDARNLQ